MLDLLEIVFVSLYRQYNIPCLLCTAIKFVVPKSFNVCAFPMYKLGNAWEMNTCVQACMPFGYKHFQEVYRLGHKCSFPKLVHGECTSLENLGNYKLYCCDDAL